MEQTAETVKSKVEKYRELAQRATPVRQVCTVQQAGHKWSSALVGDDGYIIAKSMGFEDSVFHGEAREAVLFLTEEMELRQAYADYVREQIDLMDRMGGRGMEAMQAMLPLTYEGWLGSRE